MPSLTLGSYNATDAAGHWYIVRNGNYYSFINAGNTSYALSFGASSVGAGSYSASSDSFKWQTTYMGINAPLIKQSHNDYCGVASLLQVLYALNSDLIDRTSADLKDQMDALAPSVMTADDGADRGEILNFLHRENSKYRVIYNATSEAIYSIESGFPCIAHIKPTKLFPRYIKYGVTGNGGHYATVIGYDPVSDCLVFSDCSYMYSYNEETDEFKTNFGIYLVQCDELDIPDPFSNGIRIFVASH